MDIAQHSTAQGIAPVNNTPKKEGKKMNNQELENDLSVQLDEFTEDQSVEEKLKKLWKREEQFLDRVMDHRINNGPKITIDGFPRQGNRYIRTKVFVNLPGSCIPYELKHTFDAIELAFAEEHHVILTTRNPIDCIGSFIHMSISRDEPLYLNGNPSYKQLLKDIIYTKDDITHIEKIFAWYNTLAEQILAHSKTALIVPFESITKDVDNKLIKKIINRISYSGEFIDNKAIFPNDSTKNIQLLEYLNDKKFFKLVEKANNMYNKVNSLDNLI